MTAAFAVPNNATTCDLTGCEAWCEAKLSANNHSGCSFLACGKCKPSKKPAVADCDDSSDAESEDDVRFCEEWVNESVDADNESVGAVNGSVDADEWVKGEDLNAKLAQFQDHKQKPEPAVTLTPPPPAATTMQDVTDGALDESTRYPANDIDNSIAPPEEEKIASLKAEGNVHYKEGRFSQARDAYTRAHDVYDGRKGGDAPQRAEKVKVLGNLAEACLKLREWPAALKFATSALDLEPGNVKAVIRRARALAECGGLTELDGAISALHEVHEVARANGGALASAERGLLSRLKESRRALNTKAAVSAKELKAAFAAGGGLGIADTTDAASCGVAPTRPALFRAEEAVVGEVVPGVPLAEVWSSARAATLAEYESGGAALTEIDGDDKLDDLDEEPPIQSAPPPPAALLSAFARVSAQGPSTALGAFQKVEWLCAGLLRGDPKFRRFRANASMRQALLDVAGGAELVTAIGYENMGPTAGGPTTDDWWASREEREEGEGDGAARVQTYKSAMDLFGRVKELMHAGSSTSHAEGRASLVKDNSCLAAAKSHPTTQRAKHSSGHETTQESAQESAQESSQESAQERSLQAEECRPPVDAHNGGSAPWGTWSQTRDEVQARVHLPSGTRAADLRVTFGRASLHVSRRARGGAPSAATNQGETTLAAGALSDEIRTDDCAWQLGDDGALELTLAKAHPAKRAGRFAMKGWWPSVLDADPKCDVIFCDAAETYVQVNKRAAGLAP